MRFAARVGLSVGALAVGCSLRGLSDLEPPARDDSPDVGADAAGAAPSSPGGSEPIVPPAAAEAEADAEADAEAVADAGDAGRPPRSTPELGEPRCDPLHAEQCARDGASCDLVENGAEAPSALCRWSAADSEELCTSQTPGHWIAPDSVFALEHPGSVSPSRRGACLNEPAGATTWTSVELCLDFEHAFLADGGDFPSQGTIDARGVRFIVTDGAGVETAHYADPITGCKTIALDTFGAHRVRVRSIAAFGDGNEVMVLNDDVEAVNFGWTAAPGLVPAALPELSLNFSWPVTPPGNATPNVSNVMAALVATFTSHALTTDQYYRVYLRGGTCPEPCVALDPKGNRAVFLNGNGSNPFDITRLVAELATFYRLGGAVGGDAGVAGDAGDCGLLDPAASSCANGPGHTAGSVEYPMGSEEYGNCAVSNGWAHYVSASVWNRSDQADCTYGGLSSVSDCDAPGSARASCYGEAEQTLDTGFERDWLSTFWALERLDGCGLPFAVIADIWESANPTAWAHADARSALLAAAPLHTSGAALDCFEATLSSGIAR